MNLETAPFASVKVIEYRNLLIGRFAFIMGLRMMSTLIGWWIYLLTNDPFAIGLVGLSEVIPALSLALYAGHIIDQSEKRKLLLTGIILYFLASVALVFISGHFIARHLTNHEIAICIYFIIFCTGIFRAFTGPVFGAMIAYIVPRNDLQNATTWSQGTYLAASVSGHATGGFMIALAGITGTLVATAVLIMISFFFLFKLKPKPASVIKGAVRTWESVKEGLRFVYRTKELFSSLSLDLFAVLFGGAVALMRKALVYVRGIAEASNNEERADYERRLTEMYCPKMVQD